MCWQEAKIKMAGRLDYLGEITSWILSHSLLFKGFTKANIFHRSLMSTDVKMKIPPEKKVIVPTFKADINLNYWTAQQTSQSKSSQRGADYIRTHFIWKTHIHHVFWRQGSAFGSSLTGLYLFFLQHNTQYLQQAAYLSTVDTRDQYNQTVTQLYGLFHERFICLTPYNKNSNTSQILCSVTSYPSEECFTLYFTARQLKLS